MDDYAACPRSRVGQKVRVEADIPNPDATLYPGMYGHAAVILEVSPRAISVPAACLGRDDKGAVLWLVLDGKARQRQVTVGIMDAERAEITSGLSETEQVICSGNTALRDGQPVTILRRPSG